MQLGDLLTPKDKKIRLERIVEDYYRFVIVERGSTELSSVEGKTVYKFEDKPQDKTWSPGDIFGLLTGSNGEALDISVIGLSESVRIQQKSAFKSVD